MTKEFSANPPRGDAEIKQSKCKLIIILAYIVQTLGYNPVLSIACTTEHGPESARLQVY